MSVRNLEYLFRPRSVAIIGAGDDPAAPATVAMDNLMAAGFHGPLMPVCPGRLSVHSVLAYPSVERLPVAPDLAVIDGPLEDLAATVRQLGRRGTRAAVILADDHHRETPPPGWREALLHAARASGMRLLGPGSAGLLVPGQGLNASTTHCQAQAGRIAFVSQCGGLANAVLDWAADHHIGFSHFVTLGEAIDVDFADVLDFLGGEAIDAVLLYVETIRDAQKFISAARALSRTRPVVAVKGGRAGPDLSGAAYDAALRRAGVLRVDTIEELFKAVETLSRTRLVGGDRMAVLTNGTAGGALAVDQLHARGGRLAELSDETLAALREAAGPRAAGNPSILPLSAPPESYARALAALLAAEEVDKVLVMHCPAARRCPDETAEAVIRTVNRAGRPKPVAACWIGQRSVQTARERFAAAGIPSYVTPEQAIDAYMHLVGHRRTQEILMETPSSVGLDFEPDMAAVAEVLARQPENGTAVLDEADALKVLEAYGVPVAATQLAGTPEEAARTAEAVGFPVALKIWSDDIVAKSEVGGVVLDLNDADEVTLAARNMLERVHRANPDARIRAFVVQRMVRRKGTRELMARVEEDPIFGPVIAFGQGGPAVGLVDDHAVALPPLNMNLARDLIAQTQVARLLQGHGDTPPADHEAVAVTLCRIAQMVIDFPQLAEVDVNPLISDAGGVVAVDARISVRRQAGRRRLAIRPYPKELEEEVTLRDGRRMLLRPIRPEDEPAHHDFHSKLSAEDIRFRHFGLVKQIPHDRMARLTQIDYDREMAFIAVEGEETVGVARVALDPDYESGEFAIIVRSDRKNLGIGSALLGKVVRYCREHGVGTVRGETMRENSGMIALARRLGFTVKAPDEDGIVDMRIDLAPAATGAA